MLYYLHLYYSCRELAEEYLLSHVKTAQPNNHIPKVNGYYKYHVIRIIMVDLCTVRVVHHGVEVITHICTYVSVIKNMFS